MPIKTCQAGGKSGHKWGDSGKCYTGKNSRRKAAAQAAAAFANGYRSKSEEVPTEDELLELLKDDAISETDDLFFEICNTLKLPVYIVAELVKEKMAKKKDKKEKKGKNENDMIDKEDEENEDDSEDLEEMM